MRDRFGLPLAVPDLFAAPTPSRLAALLRGREQEASHRPPIRRVPRDGPLPLSLSQRRLWLVHQIAPESTAYHLPAALSLRGRLHTAALHGALGEIVRR
ncbi:MAG TPA: hypothetical protein DD490_30985, partial [Acidobacteria bacterium]|nr:hypothetical protein [Acidobacteriota bacterium]